MKKNDHIRKDSDSLVDSFTKEFAEYAVFDTQDTEEVLFDADFLENEDFNSLICVNIGKKPPNTKSPLENLAKEDSCTEEGFFEFVVSKDDAGKRFDVFLSQHLSQLHVSREKTKLLIREGTCKINGNTLTQPSKRMREGECVSCIVLVRPFEVEPEEGELDLSYEDEHILVFNKPANLTIHPCPSCPSNTFLQRILFHYPDIARLGGSRPGIVHRLDKDTSGLVVVARTQEAYTLLASAFAKREIEKTYLAIVRGVPAPSGECHELIGRDSESKIRMAVTQNGREAHTFWKVLWKDSEARCSLLEVRIITGRTHQIRVHLAHCGFPLLGDRTYGKPENADILPSKSALQSAFDSIEEYVLENPKNLLFSSLSSTKHGSFPAESCDELGKNETSEVILREKLSQCSPSKKGLRQMLHAWQLQFLHPVTGSPVSFRAFPPKDILTMLVACSLKPQAYILTGLPGSGKSMALESFGRLGVPTWSADQCLKSLCEPGQMGWLALRGRFGVRFLCNPTETPANVSEKTLHVDTSLTSARLPIQKKADAPIDKIKKLIKEIENTEDFQPYQGRSDSLHAINSSLIKDKKGSEKERLRQVEPYMYNEKLAETSFKKVQNSSLDDLLYPEALPLIKDVFSSIPELLSSNNSRLSPSKETIPKDTNIQYETLRQNDAGHHKSDDFSEHESLSKDAWVLDRQALAEAMMNDFTLKRDVELLLHPLVYEACRMFLTSKEVEDFGMGIAEVPLWFETKRFDKAMPIVEVVGIDAPDEVRHARLRSKRAWTEDRIQAFDAMHLSRAEKMAFCSQIILNDADEASFLKAIDAAYETMCATRREAAKRSFGELQKLFEEF